MPDWITNFRPFFTNVAKRKKIAAGLMMYETDDAAKPITFRFSDGEQKGQYSLTRSETVFLAAQLNDFLDKGPDT